MGSFDVIFIGTPFLAALVITGGAIYQGVKSRQWLFVIPIPFSLCAVLSLIPAVFNPDQSAIGWLAAAVLLVIGALAYLLISRFTKTNAAPPQKIHKRKSAR
jgi:hypothetical protein